MDIKGFVEQIGRTQVRGWAYCPEHRDVHLVVNVTSGETIIAAGVASLTREDLKKSGVGDGDHAFVINFDQALDDAALSKISVKVLDNVLPPTELTVLKPAKANGHSPREMDSPSVGDLDPLRQQQAPVFVLGAARSGTSAIAQALVRSEMFQGCEEGHFFSLLPRLLGTIQTYYDNNASETLPGKNTLLRRVPKVNIQEGIKDLFRSTARTLYPTVRWLDKTPTPEMVSAAPLLLQIWPRARFIFMKRRAIENIDSRMRKFPKLTFQDHCRDWANVMRGWREIRTLLGDAAIEIEQLEMATAPHEICMRLVTMLEISPNAALKFEEAMRFEQPERTSSNWGVTLSLATTGWSSENQAVFKHLCMAEMNAYGYGLENYVESGMTGSTVSQMEL